MSVQNEGATLVFQVNTCNEDSTSVSVVESDTEIVVTASTRDGFGCSGGDDCSDPRSLSWTNLSATARSSIKTERKSVASIRSSPNRCDPVAGRPPRRDYAVRCLGRTRVVGASSTSGYCARVMCVGTRTAGARVCWITSGLNQGIDRSF